LLIAFLFSQCANPDQNVGWESYGGNKKGNRYSPLSQIDTANVKGLKQSWMYDTGENHGDKGAEIQCQPIVVNGVLYATTPQLKVFALQASTGKQIWKFDPFKNEEPRVHANRGVCYWEEGEDKRILFTAGSKLFCINAITGEQIKTFGVNGTVDLHTGLDKNLGRDIQELSVIATTPGVVYKNILVIGSTVSEFGDAAPGHIRGFNVITGDLEMGIPYHTATWRNRL
jgi:quinoprotein glucose dehydrogenase